MCFFYCVSQRKLHKFAKNILMRKQLLIVASIALIGITSCETTSLYRQAHPLTATSTSLYNSSWQLMTINGFESEQLKNDVTLNFTNDKANGFSGCNSYNAGYTLSGTKLSFSQVVATMKACLTGSKTETAFIGALRATNSYKLVNGHLHLMDASGSDVAVLVPVK